ncbi:ABC transporter ATP-binding protein [Martelella sp. HB161492]|uniref:ABC transporter ATP-binding protein n=1 Tax=Martelella sp. HB161492 TaxID=2720726 RepID=UPI00158FB012|nr:ABC transporter ATP-binding protein [Martelella sp. HB161492]
MTRLSRNTGFTKGQASAALPAAIELTGITFSYDRTRNILDRLSLAIRPGEFFSLIGPSGCGKTTILGLVSGLLEPDDGTIMIGDRDVTRMPTHKRDIGVVFQNYALFPHMTVDENVGYGLKMRGVDEAGRRAAVREALEMVGMDQMMRRFPGELSGGQQQRIGLARAVASRPRVMLLDEPLSNLDAKLREQMCIEISDLQKRLGMTMLYVTHDQGEAMAMSDRLAIMNGGIVQELGTPTTVYENPRSHFGAQFLGNVNLVTGFGEGGRFSFGDGRYITPAPESYRPGPVTLMIRPETILIDASEGHENRFEARIERMVYRGAYHELTLAVTGYDQPVLAVAHGRHGLRNGQLLAIAIPEDGIHILDTESGK